MKRPIWITAALVAIAYPLEGLILLEPDEAAVVSRFGEVNRTLQSGLHFRLPWPIESHATVAHTELRSLPLNSQRLLTSDSSLIDLTLSIQYTISDPVQFILGSEDPESQVAKIVRSASTRATAATDIDTMIDNRGLLQDRIRRLSQADLSHLSLGVRIETVDVQDLIPPPAVTEAFNDVSSAKSDRETTELAAQSYARKKAPEARGRKEEIIQEALSWQAESLAQVSKEIAHFNKLHNQYQANPEAVHWLLLNESRSKIGSQARIIQTRAGSSIVLPTDYLQHAEEDAETSP